MSSSKIFKQDQSFTRVTLVQEKISTVVEQMTAEAVDPMPRADQTDLIQEPPVVESPPVIQHSEEELAEAVEKAYNQGVNDTLIQQKDHLVKTIEAFTLASQKINVLHQSLLEQSREDMINLVIALSKKILGQELEIKRDAIAMTLQNALDQAIESEEFFVTLHPDDLARAEEMVPELLASIRGLEHLVFKIDPEMTPGGCHLESNACAVDASIEMQLESARDYLENTTAAYMNPVNQEGAEGVGES